jgi:dienelactone hydrolase
LFFGVKLFSLNTNPVSPSKVQWSDGNGLMLCPKSDQKVAGLIVVPDEWGINEFVQRELEFWANDGVCALAVNLLNDQIPKNEKEAERIKDKMDAEKVQQIISGAYQFLIRHPQVDREKIGILGWGAGGVRALKASNAENKFRAIANVSSPIYYQASMLDHLSGSLIFIYPEIAEYKKIDMEDFKKSLKKAHVQFEIRPVKANARRYYDIGYLKEYNVKATARTRALLSDFFARHLTLKQVRKEPLL